MEMAVSFLESNLYTSTLLFSTLNLNLTFMQLDQFVYQHQPDSATRHFQVDDIAPRKQFLNNFFCSHEGIPIPVSLTSMLQVLPSS